MLKKRIIPCLDIDEGRVVKVINFVNIGDAEKEAMENIQQAIRFYSSLNRIFGHVSMNPTGEERIYN